MSIPRISVALSVHNDEHFLPAAIESILGQDFGDFEFLIVNDGSTDRSGAIIDDHARRDPRIRPIQQENRGLIASLNRLIDEARAPLIARMDGDDISLPDRFARQVAYFDANPDHGVLGTGTHDIDDKGIVRPHIDRRPLDHAGIVAALQHGSPICHPSVMMRRDAVRAVGGYRPAYRHCEDYDLWLRLSVLTRLGNLPDRLIQYRRSDSQVSIRHLVEQHKGAVAALLSQRERLAARPDPTDGLAALPPIDAFDDLFGRAGVAREVRAQLTRSIVYSPDAMRGDGFDILTAHLRDGGAHDGLWRTVARLLRFGEPIKAGHLAAALLRHRARDGDRLQGWPGLPGTLAHPADRLAK
jgi:hypothetical protein